MTAASTYKPYNPVRRNSFIIITSVVLLMALFLAADVRAEQSVELLVVTRSDATLFEWPPGVTNARRIPGSRIWRIWATADRTDAVMTELRQAQRVESVEIATAVHFENSGLTRRAASGGNLFEHQSAGAAFESQITAIDSSYDWKSAIRLSALSGLSNGGEVVVAVLDTGIDLTNPLLTQRLWHNAREIPDDGIDNDGNGYRDDWIGWDFGEHDNNPRDANGHGTAVSSLVLEVAPAARILPLKLNEGLNGSFTTGAAVESLFYALAAGASVINMSFVVDTDSAALATAVRAAHASGAVLAAAAGNDGETVEFPASMDEVIAVGSVNPLNEPAWFSPPGSDLDITAPGVDIETTALGGGTTSASGTSMSAPMVSGAAAVLRAMNPHLTAQSVRALLLGGARDLGEPGRDIIFGAGLLDGSTLRTAAAPRITLPASAFYIFTRQTPLSIGFYLPPLNTEAGIFVALQGPDGLSWLDAWGSWHDAAREEIESMAALPIDERLEGVLFGGDGVFPAFDAGLLPPGSYRWGIAALDTDGRLLAPIHWISMFLL